MTWLTFYNNEDDIENNDNLKVKEINVRSILKTLSNSFSADADNGFKPVFSKKPRLRCFTGLQLYAFTGDLIDCYQESLPSPTRNVVRKMGTAKCLYHFTVFIYLSIKSFVNATLAIAGSCRNWSKKLEKCKWKPKLLLVDNKCNNGNTRTIYEICSELTIKTQERCQKRLNILVISSMTSMEHEQNEYYQI